MNLFSISTEQGWQLIGWTMIYFLAVGTALALVGGLVRFACRRASAQLRYAVSLTTFAAVALAPIGIAVWLLSTSQPEPMTLTVTILEEPIPSFDPVPTNAFPPSEAAPQMPIMEPPYAELDEGRTLPVTVDTKDVSNPLHTPNLWETSIQWLPWVWFVGAPFTFLLLSSGLIGSQRLRRQSQPVTSGPIADTCAKICSAIGVGRRVTVAVCERVTSPLMIGIFRPMILLPPAALTGWSPEQIEMVLLHELAHVRRWDNLVNLIQRMAEALLFYHPAVWLVSRQVRRDREECCDAVVVQHTAQPKAYAELLVSLASVGLRQPLAGMAMARHPLSQRVRRILKLEDERMKVSRSTIGIVAIALVAFYVSVLWQPVSEASAKEESSEATEKRETEDDSADQRTVGLEFAFPPQVFSDPRRRNIWNATQLALIKSQFNLEKAVSKIGRRNSKLLQSKQDPIQWLVQDLDVEMGTNAIRLELIGTPEEEKELRAILNAISKCYLEQLEVSVKSSTPFLTLEEQKAADLVYKMLGIELEKLDKDQLERVKEKDFKGGLIVRGSRGMAYEQGYNTSPFANQKKRAPLQSGDLLVGLHVWPVTSLQDVVKVLEREDIEELSPLKFYVIRKVRTPRPGVASDGGGGGGYGLVQQDQLVTGRLHVATYAMNPRSDSGRFPSVNGEVPRGVPAAKPKPQPYVLQPGDTVNIQVAGSLPDALINGDFRVESMGTVALGPIYGRVKIAGMDLLSAEAKIEAKLKEVLSEPKVQITLVRTQPPALPPSPAPPTNRRYNPGPSKPTSPKQDVFSQTYSNTTAPSVVPRGPTNKKTKQTNESDAAKQTAALVLEYAEKELKRLTQDYDRLVELHKRGATSSTEVREALVKVNRAKLRADVAKVEMEAGNRQRVIENPVSAQPRSASPEYLKRVAEIELKYAEKSYAVQESQFQRIKTLAANGTVSMSELTKSELEMERAKLSLERAKAELEEYLRQAEKQRSTKTDVHYDGKSFEEWRSEWKSELRIENRIKAIKAMAAFGRTGYGVRASKAIFEVAEEYDFNAPDFYSEGVEADLYHAISSSLNKKINAKDWFRLLKERFRKNPKKWHRLVNDVIGQIDEDSLRDQQIDFMIELVRTGYQGLRTLPELVDLDENLENEKVASLFQEFLGSDNAWKVHAATTALWNTSTMNQEILQVYLKGSEKVKKGIRSIAMNHPGTPKSKAFREYTLNVLEDPEAMDNTLDVLRMTAALGRHARQARPSLKTFLHHDDLQIRIAAAVAIRLVTGKSFDPPFQMLHDALIQDTMPIPSDLGEQLNDERAEIAGGF